MEATRVKTCHKPCPDKEIRAAWDQIFAKFAQKAHVTYKKRRHVEQVKEKQ